MMYRHVIDEILERKEKELQAYRRGYRLSKISSQLEAAEHVQRCIESLKRIREHAPIAYRSMRPEHADVFIPREKPSLKELLEGYQKNIPRI